MTRFRLRSELTGRGSLWPNGMSRSELQAEDEIAAAYADMQHRIDLARGPLYKTPTELLAEVVREGWKPSEVGAEFRRRLQRYTRAGDTASRDLG